ncbi:hypothetical protein ABW20_dc0101666 [Dactylellina cionopaga]|nr:hypothetical protein ABW20_dc0101666 [Dactylellina cionopaga]
MKFSASLLTVLLVAVTASAGSLPMRNSGFQVVKREIGNSRVRAFQALTPKERYIKGAQRGGANDKEIEFLNTVNDDQFEKLSNMDRKFGQAVQRIWNNFVPNMASLPTDVGGKRLMFMGPPPKDENRPSPKDMFVHWAEMKGAPDNKIQELKDKPDSDFEDLKNLNTKDKIVRQAEMMGVSDSQVNFFKNDIPAETWTELDDLKTKKHDAHQKLQDGKNPEL